MFSQAEDMQALPHVYRVRSSAEAGGAVSVHADNKESLLTGPPVEFGGSGLEWSPEELLLSAVADCYLLSFKAIAKAMRFDWCEIRCEVQGTLDKLDRTMQFTAIKIMVVLTLDQQENVKKAQRLLEKAESLCLITNSLKVEPELETTVEVKA